jgi:hypothetical protein
MCINIRPSHYDVIIIISISPLILFPPWSSLFSCLLQMRLIVTLNVCYLPIILYMIVVDSISMSIQITYLSIPSTLPAAC